MQKFKAKGSQGSWFAEIDGEQIPCVWQWWLTGNRYFDPGAKPSTGKWVEYIAAIERLKRVALTGKKKTEDGSWQREGYIGLFEVANIKVTDSSLEFDLIQPRLANLA